MQIMFLMDARVCQSVRRQFKKAEESIIKKKKGQEKEEFIKMKVETRRKSVRKKKNV